uniref:RING-type domain-containing protein n=1 Tax=viral metagenome TaxID=1070528 RepID=A0A6C0IJS2_9ZZZZ
MNNQCIICLESDSSKIYTIQEFLNIQPLLKSCECSYCIHENCIIKWITTNPTCPYCKQLLYLEHNINQTINPSGNTINPSGNTINPSSNTINPSGNTINPSDIIFNERTPIIYIQEHDGYYGKDKHICIRNFLTFICVIMIIIIINNIFFI